VAAYLTLSFALIISLGAPRSLAQGLNDPTRPPREILGGAPGTFEAAVSSSPAQVVIISKDRRQATINGRTVSLGGRYGNATLVRISDEEIVLQRPEATETIKLYSSVHRKRHWPAARADNAGKQEEENREAN
jgi:MSHA biogenesis protein MshK